MVTVNVAADVAEEIELITPLACWVCKALAERVEVEAIEALACWVCEAVAVVVLSELTEALALNAPLAIAVVEDVDDVVAAPETITVWAW